VRCRCQEKGKEDTNDRQKRNDKMTVTHIALLLKHGITVCAGKSVFMPAPFLFANKKDVAIICAKLSGSLLPETVA
jgi:hypothetical protein